MTGLRLPSSLRHALPTIAATLSLTLALSALPHAGYALTEPEKNQPVVNDKADSPDAQPDPDASEDELLEEQKQGIPMPDGLINKKNDKTVVPDDKADAPEIPTEFIHDLSKLPEPVKKLRVALVEAAASGDIERLRPLMGTGEEQTQISIGDAPEDPIAALKSLSGDPDGREIMAILLDILSTSAAHIDKGTANDQYVWPYFAEKSLDALTPPEQVELYRIVTASDVSDMKEFGSYNFYRIGISPDGKWKFFVAGD
ncbi:hypothetical protein JJB09_03935 [Rhizobium sp. KVB221]|uniref:Secreted protein n=1 Tax=Rhizobium setariae TaxID=2801340 RepID=A0A937CMP8_9HYPH|nr:hypothetical protein [Rhizobium setariae]MBL0371169.1 hypothetical protein [Rhizobium setariae]